MLSSFAGAGQRLTHGEDLRGDRTQRVGQKLDSYVVMAQGAEHGQYGGLRRAQLAGYLHGVLLRSAGDRCLNKLLDLFCGQAAGEFCGRSR